MKKYTQDPTNFRFWLLKGWLAKGSKDAERFFEQAIKDWVKERFYEAMTHRDPRLYKPLFESARDQRVNMRNGTWKDARLRISRMDSLQKDDLNEYISAIYHK